MEIKELGEFVNKVGVPATIAIFLLVLSIGLVYFMIRMAPIWVLYVKAQKDVEAKKAENQRVMALAIDQGTTTQKDILLLLREIQGVQKDIVQMMPSLCKYPNSPPPCVSMAATANQKAA